MIVSKKWHFYLMAALIVLFDYLPAALVVAGLVALYLILR